MLRQSNIFRANQAVGDLILDSNDLEGVAGLEPEITSTNLEPLFETILRHVPPPVVDADGLLQLQVTTLDYDDYKGKFAIGRLVRGKLAKGQTVALVKSDGTVTREK